MRCLSLKNCSNKMNRQMGDMRHRWIFYSCIRLLFFFFSVCCWQLLYLMFSCYILVINRFVIALVFFLFLFLYVGRPKSKDISLCSQKRRKKKREKENEKYTKICCNGFDFKVKL